ncbi:protein (fungal and plant) [Cordyceps javanica]|uniref:Protein (Fungal and plant) n=1 Tax=Cordyceps javanica TaxID=43265 RepID=A0A545V4R9_9HYPO|nr:protein (fungal and plant) [Cordyceps javanica]TQW07986.1 protein (fungal and plant) [Cordyceps javanica]
MADSDEAESRAAPPDAAGVREHASREAATGKGSASSPDNRSLLRRRLKLPALLDHFNKRDLKIVFRCWIATWVATLLIFIQPSLDRIGIATFFAALTLYIAPPATILLPYLLSAASALLGMCLAWAWGLLTMKAALAARPAHETSARLAALQQSAAQKARESGALPADEARFLVLDGFMLDARVTAVFYVMICVFIYALARLRLTNPKFSFMQIFGTIISDIFLLNAPSLPSFNASIGGVLVKPGAIGIGLGAASCVLFFPQSTSAAIMDKMESLLRCFDISISATDRRLRREPVDLAKLKADRAKLIGLWKAMQPLMSLLPLDISRCCWSADDLVELNRLFQQAMRKSVALIDLHVAALSTASQDEMLMHYREEQADTVAINGGEHTGQFRPGHHHLQELTAIMSALHGSEHGALPEGSAALWDVPARLLTACSESIDLACRCVHEVNSCRWTKKLAKETAGSFSSELQAKADEMRVLRKRCAVNTPEILIAKYEGLFDDEGSLRPDGGDQNDPMPLRDTTTILALNEHVMDFSSALEASIDHLVLLLRERTESRIWMPITIRHAVSWLVSPKSSDQAESSGFATDHSPSLAEATDAAHGPAGQIKSLKKVRELRRNGMPKSRTSRAIITAYRWLTNPAGMYAARLVIVTIATSIPSAIPHSAGFFYREKGIWAVITAQLTLLPFMADFVVSIFSRAVGTVAGGVLGMLAWYIGSGSGSGNPYGLGAITALMTVPLVWLRVWGPHMFTVAAIMCGATFALVVGFSYDDHHIYQYGLPGQGYEAFWKRVVTVFIGLLAAAIVHVFPKPTSATSHVCHGLAKSVRRMSDQYAILLLAQKRPEENTGLCGLAERDSLELGHSLSLLAPSIHLVKAEMSFGPFDQKTLQRALEECRNLNQTLSRLLSTAHSLPPALKHRFETVSGLVDDHVIGDIMAVLHIIQRSFENGASLPERLPTPLTRTFYHAWQRKKHTVVDRAHLRQESYPQYCVAISSYLRFLSTIDNLVLLLTETLGESHILFGWGQDTSV